MSFNEFSNRINLTKSIQEQLSSASRQLKLEIWNKVILSFTEQLEKFLKYKLFAEAFAAYFNVSADQIKYNSFTNFTEHFRSNLLELEGVDFYDLLNYVSKTVTDKEYIKISYKSYTFAEACNLVLEEMQSPCRFDANFSLILVTDEIALESLNSVMSISYEKTVNMYMKKASSALYSHKPENCCAEAYSAIEALVKSKLGEAKNDFSKLIHSLPIDGALKAAIKSGWGFVSGKARHGQNDDSCTYPTLQEAEFILVFTSAVINFFNKREPI